MSVVVQVWDLAQAIPLGFRRVEAPVLEKAQELAQAQGRSKVTLWDLDLAQVQVEDFAYQSAQVQELSQEKVPVSVQESALPKGYRLDSEMGLVRDFESAQVTEMELG